MISQVDQIKDIGGNGWEMIKENGKGTWSILEPIIVNNKTMKVANATKETFQLVQNTETGAWKLVAPMVKPPTKYLAKHFVRISNHTIQYVWDTT